MTEKKEKPEKIRVDGFKIMAKLKKDFSEVEKKLRSLSFLDLVHTGNGVKALYVESRDVNRRPYLFAIFRFKKDGIEVEYTVPEGVFITKRKVEMLRYVLNILTVLQGIYDIDENTTYQILDAAVKEIEEYASADYKKLYTLYESLKKDYKDLLRRISMLEEENKALKKERYELKSKNDELELKLKEIGMMSDDSIKAKITEWVIEHNGVIDIGKFSKIYNVPESKVEKLLDELVREGFMQPIS